MESSFVQALVCIAGATSGSTAILVDRSAFRVLAFKRGPALIPLDQEPEILAFNLLSICRDLRDVLGRTRAETIRDCTYVLALSGLTTPSGLASFERVLSQSALPPSDSSSVHWITRASAFRQLVPSEQSYCLVKCGTVAFAHSFLALDMARGCRLGGWGLFSGDDGGAFYIGRVLLGRYFEELDGRRRRTSFSSRFGSLLGIDSGSPVAEIAQWIRQRRDSSRLREEVASLARFANHLAEEESEPFCVQLLRRGAYRAAKLAALSFKVVERAAPPSGLLVQVHGGLIEGSEIFATALVSKLRCLLPGAEVRPAKYSPVVGAFAYGLQVSDYFGADEASTVARELADAYGGPLRTGLSI